MAYSRTTWQDGVAPAITAARLNNIEQGLVDAHAHMTVQGNPHGTTAANVGAMPATGGTMTGGLRMPANQWYMGQVNPKYGIDLQNSSIINVDEITIAGVAYSDDIGMYWLKNGAAQGSAKLADYNVFRVDGDGVPRIAGRKMFADGDADLVVSNRMRLTVANNFAYIQAGTDANDTSAEVQFSRRGTTSTNLKIFRVWADNAYFSGLVDANNVKINGAEAYGKGRHVNWGTGGPSGGEDGDIYIQY